MTETLKNQEKENIVRIPDYEKNEKQIEEKRLVNMLGDKLGISKESAQSLSELKSIKNRTDLKKELTRINVDIKKFDETKELDEIQNILNQINELKKQIDETKYNSRAEIASLSDSLKESLEKQEISSNYPLSGKIFSPDFLKKIENGETFSDNLAGIGVGSIDSLYATGKIIGEIVLDAGKRVTIHGYKIVTGKAKYEGFKDV